MNRHGPVAAIAVVALLVGACMGAGTSSGFTQLSPDTYRLVRIDGVGAYQDEAAMSAAVAAEADAYARARGKAAIPLATRAETMRAGHLKTVEYDFRLAAAGELAAAPAAPAPIVTAPATAAPAPAAAATAAAPAPPRVADVQSPAPTGPAAPALPTAQGGSKSSLYNELIMLDDLRRRGILTDAEFQALKTKLITEK